MQIISNDSIRLLLKLCPFDVQHDKLASTPHLIKLHNQSKYSPLKGNHYKINKQQAISYIAMGKFNSFTNLTYIYYFHLTKVVLATQQ